MDCSTPGFPVLRHLPELAQTHVHSVGDTIHLISSSVTPFFPHLQSFVASGSFPMSQFFTSGGQSFGASATCSGIKSLNLSRCWFSHLYYGKQASSVRCISTTVSDSRHFGEHLSGPSKIGLQGKKTFSISQGSFLVLLPWR